MDPAPTHPRTRLLDAALHVIRAKGYVATTIDDVCHQAGVTKGSFFHHFKSKEQLALAAVDYWNEVTGGFFRNSPYHLLDDPRDRVLAYIEMRAAMLEGELPDYTCLLGMMVQETYDTHPRIRDACNAGIGAHARTVAEDIEAARLRHVPDATWDAETVALYTQAVIQGAFILAKAQQNAYIASQCIGQLKQHVATMLGGSGSGNPDRPYDPDHPG